MYLHRFVIVIALVLSVLLLPCLGFSGPLDRGPMEQRYNPAADSMLRVPGVVGMYEEDARATLQQSGLSVDVEYVTAGNRKLAGKEYMVVNQVPTTGGVAMFGSSVLIKVYKPAGAGGGAYEEPTDSDQNQWGDVPSENPPAEDRGQPVEWGSSPPASGGSGGWVPPSNPIAPRPEAKPDEPVVATPVNTTVTPAEPRKEPAQTTTTESKPSRPEPIVATPVNPTATRAKPRNELTQSTETESKPSRPEPIVATQVKPTATQAKPRGESAQSTATESKPSRPEPVVATPVQQTVTPVRTGTARKPSGRTTIAATTEEQTVTPVPHQDEAEEDSGAKSGSDRPAPIVATSVQQTVTPVFIATTGGQTVAGLSSTAPTSGRVQIVIDRIESLKDTGDPKKDGKKDEVLVAVRGLWYQASDKRVLKDIKFKSSVYGDIKDHPDRRKAGSARSTGGIQGGDRVTTNLTVFDQVIGSGQELIIFPTIWEMDEKSVYFNNFIDALPKFGSSWAKFADPEERLRVPEDNSSGGFSNLGSFQENYCNQPWDSPSSQYSDRTPLPGLTRIERWASSGMFESLGNLTDHYSIPMGIEGGRAFGSYEGRRNWSTNGYKFSLNLGHLEKISKIDCGSGFGPGVLKINFLTKGPNDKNLGEYNMYLRFIVSPSAG